MLKHLRRWLGLTGPELREVRAEIDALLQAPVVKAPSNQTARGRPVPSAQGPRSTTPAAPEAPPDLRAEVVERPDPQTDNPPEPGFDPYNTGAFDRSRSWEKISKNRTR